MPATHPFRKKWGQNFLRDPNTITKIIGLLEPDKKDTILEIGPGDGVLTDRLSKTAQTSLIDILTIFLTLSIGATMTAANFFLPKTLLILALGIVAFVTATMAGVLMAKFMNLFSREKINPMIGAAGVSAVPMSARVVQKMGQRANPRNFLLMHAMGPNVAGAIGAAIAGGVFLGMIG